MNNLQTPPDLLERVIKQINYEHELLVLEKRLILSFGLLVTSFAGFVFAARDFMAQADQTGFLPILKLVTSDFGIVVHSSDYLLSLIESLPVINIALAGSVFLFFAVSSFKFFNYIFKIKRLHVH